MLEKFIKPYPGNHKYPTMVRHKGVVIAFAMKDRRIFYTVLNLDQNNPTTGADQKPKSFLDVDAWDSSPTELIFPSEIAEVGFGVADQTMLPVFKKNSIMPEVAGTILPLAKEDVYDYFRSTSARFTDDVPFQVLTDGRYVYIFRQAVSETDPSAVFVDQGGHILVNGNGGMGYMEFNESTSKNEWVPVPDTTITAPLVNATLLVDRFLLVGTRLESVMQVRYQRSRSKTRPASRKDSLGPKDLDGNIFYEPTQELRFISNLTSGRFSVLLLPTAIAEIQRWQIFAENSITYNMDSYNVERSVDGLFNTRGSQTFTCIDHRHVYSRRTGTCTEPDCGKLLIPRIVTKDYSESALLFNENGNHVLVENKPALNLTKDFTLEVWIKPDQTVKKSGLVVGTAAYSLSITENGTPTLSVTTDKGSVSVSSNFSVVNDAEKNKDTWHHIAGTYDGTTARIYINGNEDGKKAHPGSKISTNGDLYVGKSSDGTTDSFFGTIDEVRLWKRARCASELQADLYQRLIGLESDLVGYWRCDEGSGEVVRDHSNNQLNGTRTGAKWVISDAPVGEHPGVERTSFRIAGRTFKSPPTSLLYYQQSKAAGGYSGAEKYLKNAGRVMLAVATNDGAEGNKNKNHIAALDFGVSLTGRLAQIPDTVDLPRIAFDEVLAQKSANEIVDALKSETDVNNKRILSDILEKGASVTMPRVQTDGLGLTISGGVLGFAWTQDAPLLFDSATGSLALYFHGGDNQFFVAYYDTFTERARITLLSGGKDAVTCFTTSAAYDRVTMQIEDMEGNDSLCTVKVKYIDAEGNAISEIWRKVPRDPVEFSKVLNGQATGHTYIGTGRKTDDGITLSLPGARPAIKSGATLMAGDERIEVSEQILSGATLIRYRGNLNSTETLPIFLLEYDYPANATREGAKVDLTNGSILIRAIPAESGGNISNTLHEEGDLVTPLVCKWTAAAPGSTVSFDGKTQYIEKPALSKLEDFDVVSDLTLEAWVKPGQPEGQISVIQQKSTDSTYMLALERVRSALFFDGSLDEVDIPHAEQIDFKPDQDFSVEAWIKILPQQVDLVYDRTFIVSKAPRGSGGYSYSIIYRSGSGKLEAARSDTQFIPILTSQSTVNDGVFHHVAFVKDGETLRLFIDGRLESSAQDVTISENSSLMSSGSSVSLFSASRGGNPNRLKGAIDEVRIWRRARTLEVIQRDMNRRLRGDETDLVGYWHFENVEHDQAKDYSNFQNNGMIVGSPTRITTPLPVSKAMVGVREKFVQSRENIPVYNWSHLAAVYERASSLKFFGLGDDGHLDCGDSDTLDINGDLTIEISFQVNDLNEYHGMLTRGKLNSPDQNVPYSLAINKDGYIEFSFEDVNNKEHIFTSSKSIKNEIGIGKLHHLMVTRKRKSHTYSEPYHREVDGTTVEFYRNVTFVWDDIHIYIKSNLPDAVLSDTTERYVLNDDNEMKKAIEDVLQGKKPGDKYFPPTGSASDSIQWMPNDIGRSSLPLEIGKSSTGSFKGTITEVRIWNVAREFSHFDAGITGKESGLVSWWRFLERSGSTTNDSIGQNRGKIKGLVDWAPNPDPQKSSLKLYINGQVVETNEIGTESAKTWAAPVDQFALGARKSEIGFDQYFRGELEEVRIWQTTRTEEQIQDNLFRRLQGEKEDLIAYYTFDAELDNQVSDYSLRGNHLELKGSALLFDGVHDHVIIPNAEQFNFGKDQNFTVEAWIKASPAQVDLKKSDNDIIEKWSGSNDGYPFVIRLDNRTGHITAARYDGSTSGTSAIKSKAPLNDGLFHHVAFVKEGAMLRLYIDGGFSGETNDTTENDTKNDSPLYLGCRGGNKNHFAGAIEEVCIWNTARNQTAIQWDMYRRLSSNENGLVGYWHFENGEAKDHSSFQKDGTVVGKPGLSGGPTRVLSTAPVGEDTPQVRSALAGIRTPFSGEIGSTPAVQEYGDMQFDGQGNLIGVFKRCYSYVQGGKWQIITGYKVGDMVTEWIGQVQFAPQLIGFIEGAPPVPSENLTQPSVELVGDLDDYNQASVIELAEAEESNYTYSATKEGGFDMEVETGFKFGLKSESKLGAGVGLMAISNLEKSKILAGLRGRFESSWGWSEAASVGVSRTAGKTTSLELRGRYTNPEETEQTEREPFGRRFIPTNVGLALVQSETADVFALRLKHNGAMIAFQMRPNSDIPKDWNIIHFPINPRYTKQGTLDGKIGPISDVHYPKAQTYSPDSSYFKPIEAYALKNRITYEEIARETYYAQYAAQDKGRPSSMPAASVQEIAGRPNIRRNLVDTYIWTTDGGLFAESHQTLDSLSETCGGSYDFKGMGGFDLTIGFHIVAVASEFNLSAMIGGHSHLNVSKSKESKTSVEFNVNLDKVERDIYMRDPNDRKTMLLDTSDSKHPKPVKHPGKVDAYRFMSFYLEPQSDHFDDFFNLVVDPIWLKHSDDPSAVALRGARDDNQDKKPAPWRVMHRVTYVSRVLPPLDLSAPPSLEKTLQTLDIDSNYELIKQLEPYVHDHLTDFGDFSKVVDNTLEKYRPELFPHRREIKEYLSLYFGIDSGISPEPQLEESNDANTTQTPNTPPTVKAGDSYNTVVPDENEKLYISLEKAMVRDDRLEKTQDIFLTWEFIPSEKQQKEGVIVAMDTPHILKPIVTFGDKGLFALRLTASDGFLSASDQTVITVNKRPEIEITAGNPVRHGGGVDLSWTVELDCAIRTGLGDPTKYPTLDVDWSVVSGSEMHVDLGEKGDDVWLQDQQDQELLHITKTITISTSGHYLIRCVVSNGISGSAQIELEIAARITDGLQALYTFEANKGTAVSDVSGSAVPLDLAISNSNHSWIKGGLQIQTPSMLTGKANRLVAAIKRSNEITLEAWILPAVDDLSGLRRILTISNGPAARNFILAQSGTTYHVGLRTTNDSATDVNASLKSLVGGIINSEVQHIVFTRDRDENALLYINGEIVAKRTISGDFSQWDEAFQLVMGNELNSDGRSDRAWDGEYHLVAIYNRALTLDDVKQNFDLKSDLDLPPQVFAGEAREINWSVEGVSRTDSDGRLIVQMDGRVTYDRPPTSESIKWMKISGPGDVTFADAANPRTEAYFSMSGDYKLKLTAKDGLQEVSTEVKIKITHEAPVVKINIAGENLIVTADNVNTLTLDGAETSLVLDGTVKNSLGGTYPPDKLTFAWVCEPKNVFIEGDKQLMAQAVFNRNGVNVYKLTLTATNTEDEELTASDRVYVTINQPPVVDAGPDQNLFLLVGDSSVTTYLDGTVSDDGLPEPPGILKLKWSVLNGREDEMTIIADDNDFTEVKFKREGDYTLKLEADDGAVRVFDTVKITVKNNGMLPDGGRKARVVTSGLHVRQDHDTDNNKNILYFLKKDDEVTVIDLWPNPEINAIWGRLKPTEKHAQDPQWSAMKVGEDTFIEFIE